MEKAPIFLASFVKRYWRLLIVFVVINALSKIDAVTYAIGPIFFLVQMAISTVVATLFLIHCFLRRTLDAFSNDDENGTSPFERAWEAMEPDVKVKWRLIVMVAFFLGCALIASSIAK